jgi:DNA-binding MarR family transcriptional regulator
MSGEAPDDRSDRDLRIGTAIWQTEIAVDRALDAVLAPLGLTTTMQGTLRLIADRPGVSAADLARAARVRPQSVAPALARLEELGMLVRSPHSVHGRIMQIHLTEAGRKALERASSVVADFERELTAGLGAAERRRLLEQLEMLRCRADELGGRGRRTRRPARGPGSAPRRRPEGDHGFSGGRR